MLPVLYTEILVYNFIYHNNMLLLLAGTDRGRESQLVLSVQPTKVQSGKAENREGRKAE